MKKCTKCGVEKDESAFNKKASSKSGFRAQCRDCQKSSGRKYYSENAAAIIAKTTAYSRANPEKANAFSAAWASANPEKSKARFLKYRHANIELCRRRNREYRLRNLDKDAAKSAGRKARQYSATPKWLTPEHFADIALFYALATRRTKETGEKYHVDHIVPLKGKTVCGLHVPWNLQVIRAIDNLTKMNSLAHPVINMPVKLF